ncbi:MAG: hypothetical protein A2Y78_11050 [Acidobacteria bacterium RBG_13_68_16]|nr:MAG: hypothetical protein A2Y78_11050 [Acidobacteria bacterium RBG_13_68_16]
MPSGGQFRTQVGFGGFGGLSGRPPRDVVAVLVALFVTFALQFFESTAIIPATLRLTPAVWRSGFVWQLGTYAFSGVGGPSLWFLLELFIVYWFGADVHARLGRRGFWRLLALAVPGAALVAVVTQIALEALAGQSPTPVPFQLMQGQRVLMTILIASFATVYKDATILAFFVLPLRARWFVWLGIVIGFVAYLGTKDLSGFAGICGATGISVLALSRRVAGRRMQTRWLEWRRSRLTRKVDRLARKRGLRVVDRGDEGGGPTIH